MPCQGATPQVFALGVTTVMETKDCRNAAASLHSAGMNRLLFGDNLKWLQDAKVFPDASVDLVYLDPPFNSNANYNVLFKEASGAASQARAEHLGKLRDDLVPFRGPQGAANGSERSQFHAFTDTWEWTREVDDTCTNTSVGELVEALKEARQE